MFEPTTHLPLIAQVQELLDLLYPEEAAAQNKEIYQFRSEVLDKLNLVKLDPEVNQSILINLIKELQLTADQREADTMKSLNNSTSSTVTTSNNNIINSTFSSPVY